MYHLKGIADAFGAYYHMLYNLKNDPHTTQPIESGMLGFLEPVTLLKLFSEQLTFLNAPFSIKEVSQAISSLPKDKAPGPDGFSAEHYKLFNNALAPHICEMFSAAVSSVQFPDEMLSANIVT